MFHANKHCGRRAFLRGLGGTALALPLLEYTHGEAWANTGSGPRRFVTVFSHGGTISNQEKGYRYDGTGNHHGEDLWRPADTTSEALVLGPIHQALEPFKQKLLVVEGVDNKSAITQHQNGSGGHRLANVTALSAADAVVVGPDEDDWTSLGPSIDQVVAERLSAHQPTPFERIHLKVHAHNYGSPYFRASQERMQGISDPVEAFATLFAGVSSDPQPSAEALRAIKMRTSALDGLLDSYTRLKSQVSASDQQIVDAHLDHLRSLEYELQNPVVCTPPAAIEGSPSAPEIIGPLHVELLVAALRCGLTSVANLEIGDLLTPWTAAGSPTGHSLGHGLGHQARDIGPTGPDSNKYDQWFSEILANRQWRMSLMAQLLEGLDDPTFIEGDGTILDNSLVLYTSEFRNAARHVSWNMPVLLAGSAGGYFDTGRFVDYNQYGAAPGTLEYETSESTHNLFTSILQAMGESDAHFGNDMADHQGPLPGLT